VKIKRYGLIAHESPVDRMEAGRTALPGHADARLSPRRNDIDSKRAIVV